MTKFNLRAAQGEITIIKIESLPKDMETKPVQRVAAGHVISHSENGHHHVLAGGVTVLERTSDVPEGMQILYGILEEPGELKQDATVPHDKYDLDPGIFEFRISREYDPFSEQARRVAD